MRDFEKRVSRLEQGNNLGLAACMEEARKKAVETEDRRLKLAPEELIVELEVELADKLARAEEYEQSPNRLAQRMAGGIRRCIPIMQEEIDGLKEKVQQHA